MFYIRDPPVEISFVGGDGFVVGLLEHFSGGDTYLAVLGKAYKISPALREAIYDVFREPI